MVFKINNYSAGGGGSLENIQSAAYGAYPEKKIATADKAKAEIFVILNVVYSTLYSLALLRKSHLSPTP